MANDTLSDADVGIGNELSDSDVGLSNPVDLSKSLVKPGQLDTQGNKPYAGFLSAGPFSAYQPQNMQEAVDLYKSLPESALPESKAKGILPALYNVGVRPLASPMTALLGPLLAESAPLRLVAGLGFGGMAVKSGLDKIQQGEESGDKQKVLEGRLELAAGPLLALAGGTPEKKGILSAKDQIQSPSRVPVEQQSVPVDRTAEGQAQVGTPQRVSEGEQALPQPSEVQKVEAPPTVSAGEAQQQAPSVDAAKVGEAATSPTEPAKVEGGTTEQPTQGVSVTPEITQGPGAATVGDVPAAPRQALAAAGKIENGPPEERPFGPVSSVSVGLNNARDVIKNINTHLKGLAGQTMPKTTAANRLVGESGARYLSSRIAAEPMAQTFSAKVLKDTDVDPLKFGAALTEDNLRSVREALRQKETELRADGKEELAQKAKEEGDKVATIIGSKGSPFKTEDEYFDFLNEPSTKQAVGQHIQMWQEVIDPMYRDASSIDPDVPLPSRGQQTGARVNLHALFPEDPASKPIKGAVSSRLTATFRKKSPFSAQAKGTGQAYDIDYNSIVRNTFERQLEIANKNHFDDSLITAGLAVEDTPGKQVLIDGNRTEAFPITRRVLVTTEKGGTKTFSQAKNIYVRKDLAKEYRSAAGVDPRHNIAVVTPVMNLLNRAALAGLTDATVHVSNQATTLLTRPVINHLLLDTLISTTGRADAFPLLVKGIIKASKSLEVQKEVGKLLPSLNWKNTEQASNLARIGALRPKDIHFGVFGRILQGTDRLTRLMLDDTYQGLVDQGILDDTETGRREYVNQVGQYNRRAQGELMKYLRDTGFGPFVTAGRTFNALGVKMATLSPGAKASSNFAAAMLRANVLSKWVGAAVLVGTLNYLMTRKLKNGGVMGRPGTPVGNIDFGTTGKDGKQQSFPMFSLLGLGRGLRVTGIGGAINAKRMGLSNADAFESATRDIANSAIAPGVGPGAKAAFTGLTGYPPAVDVGRTSRIVPPGENQRLENAKEALRQVNPVYQSFVKYREGKTTPEILSSQIPRFTMSPGKTESMVDKYPKIVALAQGNAFIDDMVHQARKLPKEERHKFINEQVLRLPPEQRAHGRSEAVRRRVYTN